MYKLQNWDRSKLNGTAMVVKFAKAKAVVAQPAQMSGSSKARVRLPSRAEISRNSFGVGGKSRSHLSRSRKKPPSHRKKITVWIFSMLTSLGPSGPNFVPNLHRFYLRRSCFWSLEASLASGIIYFDRYSIFFPRSLLTPPMNFWHPINLNRFDRVMMVAAVDRWSEFEVCWNF